MISTARRATAPVLVYVDDTEDDIVLMEMTILRAALPFRLRQFATITAAVAYLKGEGSFSNRSLHPLPFAVLLDYRLTGVTAAEALPELLRIPECRGLPFVIFSGSESPAVIALGYRAGASHFLLKPNSPGRLEVLLKTLYDCATAHPPCYLAIRALPEYQARKPEAEGSSVSSGR